MSSPGFDPLTQVGSAQFATENYDVGRVAYSRYEVDSSAEGNGTPPARCLLITSILSIFILISAFGIRAVRAGEDSLPNFLRGSWIAEALGYARPEPIGFQGRQFGKYTEAELWSVVKLASARYHVSPQLIWAMIHVESRFDHEAKSRAGAMGLMQLMPHTAKELRVSDPFDAYQNIHGGTKYMSDLLARFKGRKEMALAAYNAGPGAVDRHNGIPPYRETRQYVTKVMGLYKDSVRTSG